MKAYWQYEGIAPCILGLGDRGEWSASRSGCFTPEDKLGMPRPSLGIMAKRNGSAPTRNWIPVVRHFIVWAVQTNDDVWRNYFMSLEKEDALQEWKLCKDYVLFNTCNRSTKLNMLERIRMMMMTHFVYMKMQLFFFINFIKCVFINFKTQQGSLQTVVEWNCFGNGKHK